MLWGTVAPQPGFRARLRHWLAASWESPAHRHDAPGVRLAAVRSEFLQSLADVRTQQVGFLRGRITLAASLRDLWHLRPEIFSLLALHFSQTEAQRRLDRLNRHFPTRSPRSGFTPLEPKGYDSPR